MSVTNLEKRRSRCAVLITSEACNLKKHKGFYVEGYLERDAQGQQEVAVKHTCSEKKQVDGFKSGS